MTTHTVTGTARESHLGALSAAGQEEIDIIDNHYGCTIKTVKLKDLTFTNGWCDQIIATRIEINHPVNKEITRVK